MKEDLKKKTPENVNTIRHGLRLAPTVKMYVLLKKEQWVQYKPH